MAIKTDKRANLSAAGSYGTALVQQLDKLSSSAKQMEDEHAECFYGEVAAVCESMARYVVNMQAALELNAASEE